MKNKTPISHLIILLTIVLTIFNSCSDKDIVPGCTDPDALNYNSEAATDDGTCQYERDKFLGNYSGTKVCNPDEAWGGSDIQFVIREDINNADNVTVSFSLLPRLAWTASVYGNTLSFIGSFTSGGPQQCIIEHGTTATMQLTGTATLNGNQFNYPDFTYSVLDEAYAVVCRYTCEIDALKN